MVGGEHNSTTESPDTVAALIRCTVGLWSGLPDTADEALECLGELGDMGDVRSIAAIVPYISLPDDPDGHLPWYEKAMPWLRGSRRVRTEWYARLRSAARRALVGVMGRVSGLDWVVFDEMARRNTYSTYQSRQRWEAIEPPVLDELPDDDALRHAWLALLSCHPNGYVREGALLRLAGEAVEVAYPVALVRANDWVAAIRFIAMEAVRQVCEYGDYRRVVDHLPLLLRLKHCERDVHEDLIEDALRALFAGGNVALETGMSEGSAPVRRAIVKVADRAGRHTQLNLVRRAAEDEDLLVRLWSAGMLGALWDTDPAACEMLRARFLGDPAGAIRRSALESLVAHDLESSLPTLERALLDTSGAVRHLARYYLKKAGRESDFAQYYREALGADSADVRAALSGLAETGRVEDAEIIEAYLEHDSPKVVCAALRALERLDDDGTRRVRLEAILHPAVRVSREALNSLGHRLREADFGQLMTMVGEVAVEEQAMALVTASQRMRAWPSLELLLRIAGDCGEGGRPWAMGALSEWTPGDDERYAVPPPSAQRARSIKTAFTDAGPVLTLPLRVRLTRLTAGLVELE